LRGVNAGKAARAYRDRVEDTDMAADARTRDAETRQVLEELRARFRSDRRIGPHVRFVDLSLDASGTLTLAGEVPDIAAKKRALEIAAMHASVSGIVDRVRVTPAAEMGDAEIRAHLRTAFTQGGDFAEYAVREQTTFTEAEAATPRFRQIAGDPGTARGRIDIEVRNGVVILNGEATGLTAKRLAGAMAWWVPGVRDVVNGLEVTPPEDDAPIRIEDAVRVVLDRDPLVDAGQIRVGVRHRTVRLTGAVRSDALRRMAERDAWYVFGVDDVINEIEVIP
jgi:osmotically-inducible protein OsmY